MEKLLIAIASKLVSNPDQISVSVSEPAEDGSVTYTLSVAEEDKGRVIGKQGRIAKSIRTVMRAAGTRINQKISVEIE